MAEISTLQRTDNRVLEEGLEPSFNEGAIFPISEAGGAPWYMEIPSDSSNGDVTYNWPNPQTHLDFSNVKWVEDSQYRPSDFFIQATLPYEKPGSTAIRNRMAPVSTFSADTNKNPWPELQRLLEIWQQRVAEYGGQKQLAVKLQASFEENPVEDGMEHPAEEIIHSALYAARGTHVFSWSREFCADASQPSFAASVLRCLGRCERIGTVSWRVGLVRDGLAMDDVEIRDASVQAAESWGDSEMVEVLRAHDEPEPWLREYVSDVIEDLTG